MNDCQQIKVEGYRNNNLNIVRFIAALMVIYGHMYVLTGTPSYTIYHYNEVSTIGVEIFFLISGYLVTESYLRESNLIIYWIKRFFRIIPALVAVTFITAFIIGPLLSDYSLKEYFGQHWSEVVPYLKNIFLFTVYTLPGVFINNTYPNAVNGSLWTLPLEVLMYVLLPILLVVPKILKKIDRSIIFLVVVVIATILDVYIWSKSPGKSIMVYNTNMLAVLRMVPYFFTGALFTSERIKSHFNIQIATICIVVFSMINTSAMPYISPLISIPTLAYFIFSFSFIKDAKFSGFCVKNDYSYGIYLYGFLVQQIIIKYLGKYNLSVNKLALLSMLGACVCALFSWHLIEKPAQKLGKKICVWVKQKSIK